MVVELTKAVIKVEKGRGKMRIMEFQGLGPFAFIAMMPHLLVDIVASPHQVDLSTRPCKIASRPELRRQHWTKPMGDVAFQLLYHVR